MDRIKSILAELSPTCETRFPGVLWAILLLVTINYITTPLGGDQQVNIAFAQQAELIGQFPRNLLEAWTLRGIGYKTLVYTLYKFANIAVPYEQKALFEPVFKTYVVGVYSLVVAVALWFSYSRFETENISSSSVGFIVLIGFFTLSHRVAFSSEGVAALLSLLAVAIGISDREFAALCGAFVLALLPTIKGITGLLIPVSLLLIFVFERGATERLFRISVYIAGWVVLINSLLLLTAPAAITDLLIATQFQGTFEKGLLGRFIILAKLRNQFTHLPIVAVGGPTGVLLIGKLCMNRNYKLASAVAALGLIPLLSILIQARAFYYHFAIMIPTAIALIILLGKFWQTRIPLDGLLILLIIVFAGLTVSPVAVTTGSSPVVWDMTVSQQEREYDSVKSNLNITPDTTALYLSDGTATYYLEAESHLRYYYPLPLQRISWRSSLRSSEIHQRVYNKALEYEGRITVLQPDWFPIDEFPELEQKIENKYCVAARVNINYAGRGAGPGTQNIVIYERCTNKTTRCSY